MVKSRNYSVALRSGTTYCGNEHKNGTDNRTYPENAIFKTYAPRTLNFTYLMVFTKLRNAGKFELDILKEFLSYIRSKIYTSFKIYLLAGKFSR